MNTIDYFNNRRTVRSYSDREISDEELHLIIDSATHAPTTGNMQLYSVIATRSSEGKKALAPAHFNQPTVTSCSVVLTICADFNRFNKWCRQRDAIPGYDNFQSFITALLDATILAQQICTIAELRGIGCCYLGTTTYNAPDIARALRLPSHVVPVTTLTLGYPATLPETSDRLPLDAILHNETYKDYSPSDIDQAYREKEARPDSAVFIAENGKDTLAQVFTDIRYPRKNNEYFSNIYYDFIERQGFAFPDTASDQPSEQ
ncbi:MAG: nitroreductase family protein [Pseudoflavonifractor sp.]|nr:nitroreductase family protein [Pseudoflavonifractor sp.]